MIELNKTTTVISAPTSTVFNYVTNMENYGDWFPGVVAIKSKNNLPHATVGKSYSETLLLPNGECELTIEVAQCETNQLFLTQGDLDGIFPQMTIAFSEEAENKCRMTLQYHSRSSSLTAESEIIIALRQDLAHRASVAIENLKQKFIANK